MRKDLYSVAHKKQIPVSYKTVAFPFPFNAHSWGTTGLLPGVSLGDFLGFLV